MRSKDKDRPFWARLGPWVVVAYFGLAGLFVANERVNERLNKRQVEQVAKTQAQAAVAYRGCIASIPELAKISRHLLGVNELAAVLVLNSRAVAEVTPRSDPSYAARHANLERLEDARRKIAAVRALPVPTKADCEKRRAFVLSG